MLTRILIITTLLIRSLTLSAQEFAFGSLRLEDLQMDQYERDTSAGAVVLKELGEASISNGDGYDLIFKYHVRIKILKKIGLSQADIEIPLYRQSDTRMESIRDIRASSFNIENGRIHEQALHLKEVFSENRNEHYVVKRFAIPNVRVGSVIEYTYTIQSPFVYNFRPWEFQSDIPKIQSEYEASIPGVYRYNITLRGFLPLDKNNTQVVKGCLGTGQALAGGYSADCAVMRFGMMHVPAFVEEDYMTAKKNFLSAIHFELAEIRYFDGRVDKITREWKDAEEELRGDSRFGVQLKRGKDLGKEIESLVAGEHDELAKARKVYDFIKGWYTWNDTYGKYSEFGIKKAFDERKGNVGDINLSLVAAMRFAGLNAEPVILSTRANGIVVELHPVLSEFNYVIARVSIGEKVYLVDATEKHYPFGMLPERCLNGKGRVIGDRKSYWVDLKPAEGARTLSVLTLVLHADGIIRGTISTTFTGYDAVSKRSEILSHPSVEAYVQDLRSALGQIEIVNYEIQHLADIQKAVTRKLEVEIPAFTEMDAEHFLFNPFLLDKWSENPFKSSERQYPVDFGVPLERMTVLQLEYPPGYDIVNLPEKIGLSLPEGGGRYVFLAENVNNKLSMNNTISIRKAVYSSVEYHYLKELFNRIIQVQNGELIFRKKT